MKTRLEKLHSQVEVANTATADGRQEVANACRELYNTIEEQLYNKYGQAAIDDAYNDLMRGNFAEPFMCEKKKEQYNLYEKIYLTIINK